MSEESQYQVCGKCGKCDYCKSVRAGIRLVRDMAKLCNELKVVKQKRDMWLRIAQRLFKERQTMLHGHVYDLPTDDVILEATVLDIIKINE